MYYLLSIIIFISALFAANTSLEHFIMLCFVSMGFGFVGSMISISDAILKCFSKPVEDKKEDE